MYRLTPPVLSTAPFAPTLPVSVPPSAKAKIEPFLFKATGTNTLAENVMGFAPIFTSFKLLPLAPIVPLTLPLCIVSVPWLFAEVVN
ncbi:hypothetical protein [Rickettsia fournieri]|uniref:hypothetical protein n=1 Tax=Rickettsia fournieri TaxID=1436798 RepID=UPI001ADFD9BB|nr:hypothetical protein [Rickettsia fournieri]